MSAWLAVLALAGCGEAVELDRLPAAPSVAVVEARTGDTLTLQGGGELKLAGIEAPGPDQPYGAEARRLLNDLARGQTLNLGVGGAPADATGRRTAQARIAGSGTWLEGELLRAGAARVRTSDDDRALAGRMLDAEAEARRAGRGMWRLPAYRVRLPQEVPPAARGFELVEGRVKRTGRTGAFAYLDFSEDWRSGLSVHLPLSALDDFHMVGRHPLDLKGRLIRVRGMVEGRVLWIDHPEALEVLREP